MSRVASAWQLSKVSEERKQRGLFFTFTPNPYLHLTVDCRRSSRKKAHCGACHPSTIQIHPDQGSCPPRKTAERSQGKTEITPPVS